MRARGKESRTYVYVRIIIIVWNSTLRNLDSCLVHLNAILFYLECDLSISEYTYIYTHIYIYMCVCTRARII